MKRISVVVCLLVVLFFVNTVNAELFVRGTDSLGNQLIYDSDLNITWYDYLKSYNTWYNQMNWASALTVNFGGTIFDDWRLPATVDGPYVFGYDGTTTAGFHITSSEMGHLFYTELGNVAYCSTSGSCPQSGWGLTNKGDFQNLIANNYWSGTEKAEDPIYAWEFAFSTGQQHAFGKYMDTYTLAVRAGDVAVVPEPISSILFVTGGTFLAGRSYLRRKKKA